MRRTRGLTLVETAIVAGVLSLFTGALYALIFNAGRSYTSASRLNTLQRNAQVALDRLCEELRWAEPESLVVGTSSLTLRKSSGFGGGATTYGGVIAYAYELSDVDANNNGKKDEGRLTRTEGGKKIKLCDYVKANGFVVTRSGSRITLALTLEVDGQTVTIGTSVVPRNKSSS